MTAEDIGRVLTNRGSVFPFRRWLVVPNVYWGWDLNHEADLIAVSPNGYAVEIEIKVSLYDLKADRCKKKHQRLFSNVNRIGDRISRLYYAVPTKLVTAAMTPAIVSPAYGVIEILEPKNDYDYHTAAIVRKADRLPGSRRCTDKEIHKLAQLGVMRLWTRGEIS